MSKLHFTVSVRDKYDRLHKDSEGYPVPNFKFEMCQLHVKDIEAYCKVLYRQFKAIAKEGSSVDVEVSVYNNISDSYMCMHSLYDCSQLGVGQPNFISH